MFGNSSGFPATLALSTLDGTNGFRLHGGDALVSVGRAGDINGDGVGDVKPISSRLSRAMITGPRDVFGTLGRDWTARNATAPAVH